MKKIKTAFEIIKCRNYFDIYLPFSIVPNLLRMMLPKPTAVIIKLTMKPINGRNANKVETIPSTTAPEATLASSDHSSFNQRVRLAPMTKLIPVNPQISAMRKASIRMIPIGLKQIVIIRNKETKGVARITSEPTPHEIIMFFLRKLAMRKVGILKRKIIRTDINTRIRLRIIWNTINPVGRSHSKIFSNSPEILMPDWAGNTKVFILPAMCAPGSIFT